MRRSAGRVRWGRRLAAARIGPGPECPEVHTEIFAFAFPRGIAGCSTTGASGPASPDLRFAGGPGASARHCSHTPPHCWLVPPVSTLRSRRHRPPPPPTTSSGTPPFAPPPASHRRPSVRPPRRPLLPPRRLPPLLRHTGGRRFAPTVAHPPPFHHRRAQLRVRRRTRQLGL